MYSVIECLTQKHNYTLVLLAAIICTLGSGLSVRLFMRTLTASEKLRRYIQLTMATLVAAGTIWSTHFIGMLAFEPGYETGYDPLLTGLSFIVAIIGVGIAMTLALISKGGLLMYVAGAGFGMTVAAMHYVGMSAYLLPGHIQWDFRMVTASVALGSFFGIISYHRIFKPVTKYCWLGGVLAMVLGICSMHFTGMVAFSIEFDPRIIVPPKMIADTTLGILILAIMLFFLMIGLFSVLIEDGIEVQAQNMLQTAALTDNLTGLPNRLSLQQQLASCREDLGTGSMARVAILTLDLDLFKEVNDTYGHKIGDDVLKTVAKRMAAALGPNEYIARSGGDEFVALTWGWLRMEEVYAFASRLRAHVLEPISHNQGVCSVGVSVGFATYPDDGDTFNELLQKSSQAMYQAKSSAEHKLCHFDIEMEQQSRDRVAFINDLRSAQKNEEFELHYQLQNDLMTLDAVGFEVLLRWNHPVRGRVSPGEFIPTAEETGLIREIGLWVLRTACQEAASWPHPYSIAVNVAPQQLIQPSFVENVLDILFETKLAPERLELEITEASIIDDQANTLKVMHKLKKMGIRIAMDDFGTGYSSLASLRAFPFDKIKIDRSFVTDVHKIPQSAAIVRSTLLLGSALNIPVLAEGVEQIEEIEFLRSESCAEVQGFYFGKPMTQADARAMVERTAMTANIDNVTRIEAVKKA